MALTVTGRVVPASREPYVVSGIKPSISLPPSTVTFKVFIASPLTAVMTDEPALTALNCEPVQVTFPLSDFHVA
ncbi:hypothetical protein D3C76_1002600 [compost metagenome]